MQYDKIKKRPVQFLGITGLTVADFDFLLPHFKIEWDNYNDIFTLEGKPRQRKSYSRTDSILPKVSDKLFFVLIYLKTNPLQEQHAASFQMTQPQANILIHLLSDILRKTLKQLGELQDEMNIE